MQLTLTLGKSPGFSLLLLVGGGLAQIGFWSLPGYWAGVSALVGAAYLFQQWWVHIARYSPESIVSLKLISDNQWQVDTRQGRPSDSLKLLPGGFCHPLLVMLRFKDPNGQKYALIIPADAVASEPFRQLRVVIMASITE
ncbi:MAG: hypothetical protein JKY89_08125 [Immundisolibacteraceae bacterium]|nr:hypothetical protein [Immundisolibacteraceae bacterium]